MARWVRVDDDPDEPIRINLVVDRKKHPKIAYWFTNIKYGKASDEIRKALEFYIDHGCGSILPVKEPVQVPNRVFEPVVPTPVPTPVPEQSYMPPPVRDIYIPPAQSPVRNEISTGAAGVLDDLENRF